MKKSLFTAILLCCFIRVEAIIDGNEKLLLDHKEHHEINEEQERLEEQIRTVHDDYRAMHEQLNLYTFETVAHLPEIVVGLAAIIKLASFSHYLRNHKCLFALLALREISSPVIEAMRYTTASNGNKDKSGKLPRDENLNQNDKDELEREFNINNYYKSLAFWHMLKLASFPASAQVVSMRNLPVAHWNGELDDITARVYDGLNFRKPLFSYGVYLYFYHLLLLAIHSVNDLRESWEIYFLQRQLDKYRSSKK